MKRFFTRLFNFSVVRWVRNDDIKHHTEDPYYMHVNVDNDDYLFTKEQIRVAKERALKNPEDTKF